MDILSTWSRGELYCRKIIQYEGKKAEGIIMTTTVKEIAKALEISPSTISRDLNYSSKVKRNNKEMVLSVSKKMSYQTNIFTEALATNKNII